MGEFAFFLNKILSSRLSPLTKFSLFTLYIVHSLQFTSQSSLLTPHFSFPTSYSLRQIFTTHFSVLHILFGSFLTAQLTSYSLPYTAHFSLFTFQCLFLIRFQKLAHPKVGRFSLTVERFKLCS